MTRTSTDPASSRLFDHHHVWRLTDGTLAPAAALLADAARLTYGAFSAVIGIANGGRIPAACIAALLEAPLYDVRARHNLTDAVYTQATGQVGVDLASLPDGNRLHGQVLLIDDICGSGATLRTVHAALTATDADIHLVTATLCRNEGADFTPDLWLWNVRDWVTFPWETPHPYLTTDDLPLPARVQRG